MPGAVFIHSASGFDTHFAALIFHHRNDILIYLKAHSTFSMLVTHHLCPACFIMKTQWLRVTVLNKNRIVLLGETNGFQGKPVIFLAFTNLTNYLEADKLCESVMLKGIWETLVNNWNQLRQGEIKSLEIILDSLSYLSIPIKMESKLSVFSKESGNSMISWTTCSKFLTNAHICWPLL